jgi:mono/diheme cytochrome c family protein
MPSEIFQHLSDTDLAAITSYLRTLKPAGEPTGKPLPFEADAKKLIVEGKIMPAAQSVVRDKGMAPADLGKTYSQGRYITMVTCAECHGPELKGQEGDTPNLIVVGGYSRDEFETLMTKGILPGGRKFKNPLMGEVAQGRFGHFTPHERDALYAYLKARAEQPQ